MKKNLLLLVLALIGMGSFTACNNEDDLLVQEQTNAKPVVIRATIGDVSRLALGESVDGQTKLSWGTGDAFALKIGEETYTFNWQEGNDFVYANNNGDFPETFATAGIITATYPATAAGDLSVQSGTKANVGNYMQMTASKEVTAGQPTTNLNLSFEHQTSVVEITLENNQYANLKAVVELRTQAEAMYSTPTEDAQQVQFDGSGKLTVYFAVSPTDAEVSGWYIGLSLVFWGDTYYDAAPLSDLKLDASKMYKVSKGSSDLKMAYKIDDAAPSTVIAYNAIGLYKWREMATEDPTNNVVNLELGDDITLPTEGIDSDTDGPVEGNWTPVQGGSASVPPYKGSIDGKNHTIKNMYIVDKTIATGHGFIGYSDGGIFKDLKFDGAKIVVGDATDFLGGGGKYVGVISGSSDGNFDNCHVTGSTLKSLAGSGTEPEMMGGLVGQLSAGKITSSSFNGTVDGNKRVGGIVGNQAKGTEIVNCNVSGTVKASLIVGGIAGTAMGFVGMCTNEATVSGSVSGGVAGELSDHTGTNASCIMGCTNMGKIDGTSATQYVGTGGIVGRVVSYYNGYSFVIGCRNLSEEVCLNVSGDAYSNYVAGVVGIFNNATKTPTGVYGSYTVKMKEDTGYQYTQKTVGIIISGSTAVNQSDYSTFDSETDTDLTDTKVTEMNDKITLGVTAAKGKSIINNTYNAYRWSWTSGSWPVFEYAD